MPLTNVTIPWRWDVAERPVRKRVTVREYDYSGVLRKETITEDVG